MVKAYIFQDDTYYWQATNWVKAQLYEYMYLYKYVFFRASFEVQFWKLKPL